MIKILRTSGGKILRTQRFDVKMGFLYNFPAVAYSTGGASIAPAGWHVPTNAECATLDAEIANVADKLKETGTLNWNSPNTGTNETGFSARGSGESGPTGGFLDLGIGFVIWTSTSHSNPAYAYYAAITYGVSDFITGNVSDKRKGQSVRLIKDDSVNAGTMQDIDGNVYPTVKIGNQVWMAANLAVKRFNDGTPIPEITDGTEWSLNTTGARCSYNNDEANSGAWTGIKSILRRVVADSSELGLLYNKYAIDDSRKITSSDDWSVFTNTQYNSLCTYLGGYSVAGGKLKETGTTYWQTPNTGATNEFGFNGRGTGYRLSTGGFSSLKTTSFIWTSALRTPGNNYVALLSNSSEATDAGGGASFESGISVRLVKNAAGVPDGSTTIYTGNDGRVYSAVAINELYWLQQALAETRFRTGEIVPWYGADAASFFTNSEWAALATAGCAAYNNDITKVAPGFTFPTP